MSDDVISGLQHGTCTPDSDWRAGASQPSRTTDTIFLYNIIVGERERANLVVQLARFFYIYIYFSTGAAHTVYF